MFTHLKKFTIILALQKNFFIHSSVLHASHSSTVMKRSERSSGHRFSGEVAGHSSKLHIPPAADQVPSNTWKKNLFGLFKGTCYAIIAIVQLKVESEGCLCLIPCCWSPLKRDVFFMCNVRIWSWTCQKHEKQNCSQAQLPINLSPFSQNQTITSFHLLQEIFGFNLLSSRTSPAGKPARSRYPASGKITSIGATQVMFHALRVALNSLVGSWIDPWKENEN